MMLPNPTVVTTQERTVAAIDARADCTRLLFRPELEGTFLSDSVSVPGFAPVSPGTRVRLTIEYLDVDDRDVRDGGGR